MKYQWGKIEKNEEDRTKTRPSREGTRTPRFQRKRRVDDLRRFISTFEIALSGVTSLPGPERERPRTVLDPHRVADTGRTDCLTAFRRWSLPG